ncbi:hypothetical protein CK203_006624 [Vitis vinifera]|uniref:Uncharacterized protein n=1 Tax=Vitis vinifera TaxID=29760 RepID=A0A438KAV2_VITVI|nr:hypothetical protein CK203_006624 [Vitis vinifera]
MCLPQGAWSHNGRMQVPPLFGRKAHKAGHLKQYLRSDAGGPSDEEYDSKRKRQKLLRRIGTRAYQLHPAWDNWRGPSPHRWDNHFPPVDPTRILQPHRDALIMSLEIGDFDVRRILVDPGSSPILCKHRSLATWAQSHRPRKPWANPIRIQRVVNYSLGDIVLPVQAGPVTLNVQFSVDGQIDLYGSQLAARQCYQIAREAGTSQEDASLPESSHARDQ